MERLYDGSIFYYTKTKNNFENLLTNEKKGDIIHE